MAKDRRKLQHIHSSIKDRQPSPSTLEIGELAVNNNAKNEFISLKNTDDKVVRFSSDEQMITWMEKKEVIPYVGYVRGETGPSATSADTPTSDAMGSYGITNNDLLNNTSEIIIKLNQVVADETTKHKKVNGKKDKYNKEINPTTDGGLNDGAGFFIDMSRYAMNDANPSFSSVTVSAQTTLSGNTYIRNGASANTYGTDTGHTLEITIDDVKSTNKTWTETITSEVANISGRTTTIGNNNEVLHVIGTTTETHDKAVNITNGATVVENTSGTTTENRKGLYTENNQSDHTINTTGDVTVNTTGNTTIQSTGTGSDVLVYAKDVLTETATTVNISGSSNVNVSASTATTSAATTNITGSTALKLYGGTIDETGTTVTISGSSSSTLKAPTNSVSGTNTTVVGSTNLNMTGATTTISGSTKLVEKAPTVEISGGTVGISGTTTIKGNTTVDGTITAKSGLTVSTGGAAITGNSTVSGNLTVTGTTNISGATRIDNNLTVSGNTKISGTTDINGKTTIDDDLKVTGTISGFTNMSGTSATFDTITCNSGLQSALKWKYESVSGASDGSYNASSEQTIKVPKTLSHVTSGKITSDSSGNMTVGGKITTIENQYQYETDPTSYGIDMRNSDLVGVDALYFSDFSENWNEGIQFGRDDSEEKKWDSLYAQNGTFYIKAKNGTEQANLNIGGTITAGGAIYSSDINLKENVQNVDYPTYANANGVPIRKFNFKNDETKRTVYGVIAQEVEIAGLEDIVAVNEDGFKGVDYTALSLLKIAYLENKVKELEAMINKLTENK